MATSAGDRLAEVIPLHPVQSQKLCSDCEFCALSAQGVYCIELREVIWNEKVAEECELFEEM